MTVTEALYGRFAEWVDRACSRQIPPEALAFSFNLAETSDAFVMELIGSPRFDPSNPDWACDEVFEVRDPEFELPHSEVGREWEPVLQLGVTMVRRYLQDEGNAGLRLREAKGVGVGFVDGDLEIVWPEAAA
jgi:hypothetical protein